MKRALACLSVLVFPFCALSETKEDSTPPAITVYTQFEGDHSEVSFEEMKKELDAIMGPIGLHFEWRSLQASHGNEVAVELVVVSFKGQCEMNDALVRRGETGALGWTHMSDGDVLPFSDVECDRIRRFIAPQVASAEPAERERVFGRAMGRVLAHELYHVFTNTTRHGAWGVAKAFYTPRELVSDSFQFQEKESKALRNGKLRALLRHRPKAPLAFTGQ